jgi:hypothetical protein
MEDKLVMFGLIALVILSIVNAKNPIKNSRIFPNEQYSQTNTSGTSNSTQESPEVLAEKVLEKDPVTSKLSLYLRIYGGYGSSANEEYITIENTSKDRYIDITDFKLKSTSTNIEVTIPKTVKLYFTGMQNVEENVILGPQERAYVITGKSPTSNGMKLNKCSGYLTQYNNFSPSFSTNCPAPRNEDLSSIPKTVNNDICFDLIDYYPSCRVQSEPISNMYSSECQNFIYKKINYPNCINTHKNDSDFWEKTWYVYLKRSEKIWKDRREVIVLYDRDDKVISKITK